MSKNSQKKHKKNTNDFMNNPEIIENSSIRKSSNIMNDFINEIIN